MTPSGPPRKRAKGDADRLQGKLFLQAVLWISGKTKVELAWDYASLEKDGVKSSPSRQFHRWANGALASTNAVSRLEQDFPGVAKWHTSGLIEITRPRWRWRAAIMHHRSRCRLFAFERSVERRESLRSLVEDSGALDSWLDCHDLHEQGEILARILVSLLSIRGPAPYFARTSRKEMRGLIQNFHRATARVLSHRPYAALADSIQSGLMHHLEPDESPDRICLPRTRTTTMVFPARQVRLTQPSTK